MPFLRKILCWLGFHDRQIVLSKTGQPSNLMNGWKCRRCPSKWGPLEWPSPPQRSKL